MKVVCWKCRGVGKLRNEPLTSPMSVLLGVASLGVVPLLRTLCESDPQDSYFWHTCKICDGKGYQETAHQN